MKAKILFICLLLVSSIVSAPPEKNTVFNIPLEKICLDRTGLNDSNVIYWLNYYQVQYPEIVLKQIKLETGNYTSRICLISHNLTGMKFAWVRPSVAFAEQFNHAAYENWQLSILDYRLWQLYNSCKLERCKDYYLFLKHANYATGKEYTKRVKSIY